MIGVILDILVREGLLKKAELELKSEGTKGLALKMSRESTTQTEEDKSKHLTMDMS